jgi:hypothetical protein
MKIIKTIEEKVLICDAESCKKKLGELPKKVEGKVYCSAHYADFMKQKCEKEGHRYYYHFTCLGELIKECLNGCQFKEEKILLGKKNSNPYTNSNAYRYFYEAIYETPEILNAIIEKIKELYGALNND